MIVLAVAAMCMLWSVRLAVVLLMLSYYFSNIVWKCPMCKR